MRIFLSYAWQDREQAKSIYLALRDQGHEVFFDRADLPAGDEYHNRIRAAIERSRLFMFLISPHALDAGSYTLTELEVAEKGRRRLLPVMLADADIATLPATLKAVTIHRPEGNVAASVAAQVHRIAEDLRRKRLKQAGVVLAATVLIATGFWYASYLHGSRSYVGKDGAPAALIPGGLFVMGDDENTPRREIYLDAFYMDRYEVTVARYARFLKETGDLHKPDEWPEGNLQAAADLPVIGVDWRDADSYCRWAGKRLPTEAEWQKAARGSNGRKYPWGNDEPAEAHARFGISSRNPVYAGGVAPVGKHAKGAGPYGMHDLAGNVSEWVADWYAPGFERNQKRNPKGPNTGTSKIVRGGGWMDAPERITTTKRMYLGPEQRMDDIGFRCAADVR